MSPLLSSLCLPTTWAWVQASSWEVRSRTGKESPGFLAGRPKKNFGSLADTIAIMERGSSGKQPGGFVSEARPILRPCKCGPDPGQRTTHRL